MSKFIDLTGQRFGSWLVLERVPNDKNNGPRWLCRCDCGREKVVYSSHLRYGNSRGCRSCHIKSIHIKHGQYKTRLFRIWQGIIARCENANCKSYKNYGERGVTVCSEWRKDIMAFRRWALSNGYKADLVIDRIDNNGNYEPENCQFITGSENSLKAWHVDGSYNKK